MTDITQNWKALLTSAIFIINKYAEFVPETWSPTLKAKAIKIDGLSVTLNEEVDSEKSIYCIKKVSKGKHKWKFRYDKVKEREWNLIGIGKANIELPLEKAWMGHGKGNGYAYAGPQGIIAEPKWENYGGRDCKSGDVVEMVLDFDKRTLGYIINGKDYGVADDNIEQTVYRAGVTLYKPDDKITLLHYQQM